MTTQKCGFLIAVTAFLMFQGLPAAAQDVLKVESVVVDFVPGSVVSLDLYLKDASGTVLGGDRGTGNTIQGISMTLQVDPVAGLSGVDFVRAGITDGLVERYETERIDNGNRVTWLISFDEVSSPLTTTLDSFDLIGQLNVTLSSQVPSIGAIDLTLAPGTTGLSNARGSRYAPGGTGQLQLISGVILSTALFSDGFEAGDTSAWSSVNP